MEENSEFDDPLVQRMSAIYKEAKAKHDRMKPTWEEIFDYVLPGRGFYNNETNHEPFDIFDSTAVNSAPVFASTLLSDLMPSQMKWVTPYPGSQIPEADRARVKRELEALNTVIFESLHESNFETAASEAFLDLGIGTGNLLAVQGDVISGTNWSSQPIEDVVLYEGPLGDIDGQFREIVCAAGDIKTKWPDAKLDDKLHTLSVEKPREMVTLHEGTLRDHSQRNKIVHDYCVWHKKSVITKAQMQGEGSSPWISFRYFKIAKEAQGRGPFFNSLPAIRVLNLAQQYILENGDIALGGMFQYEHDGVINPDNIDFGSRMMLPIAQGSRGLMPINSGVELDMSQIIIESRQNDIKKSFLDDQMGDLQKTPRSVYELAERQGIRSKVIGSTFGRLMRELVYPVYRREVYIQKQAGNIKIPKINGREIRLIPQSPLASAQKQGQVNSLNQYLQLLKAHFGEQTTNLIVDQFKVADEFADLMAITTKVLRDGGDRKQMLEQIQSLVLQQQGGGMGGGEADPAASQAQGAF